MHYVHLLLISVILVGVLGQSVAAQTRGGFDSSGHLLMHGTPRFVLGVYDSGGGSSTAPAHWNSRSSPSPDRGGSRAFR
jgi:hypothetical protein